MLYATALRSIGRSRSFRMKTLIHTLIDAPFCSSGRDMRPFGKDNVWTIFVEAWKPSDSLVVYSGGVGKDISTELELCSNFDCVIYLYDPSPTGISTMRDLEYTPANLAFSPQGLAGFEGSVSFAPPDLLLEGSYQVAEESRSDLLDFPCVRLSDEIRRHGHSRVHLLKLDIEGFEYEVLADVLSSGVQVDQICVEFHHFLAARHKGDTDRALRQLVDLGYVLMHKSRYDYTFVLGELLHREQQP